MARKTNETPPKSKKRKKAKPPARTAKTSDRHELYQLAVQAPDVDAPFLKRYFKRYVGRPARSFREDFCGTAFFSCHWVKLHAENRAIGVDLDGPTLRWGQKNNVEKLLTAEEQTRIELIEADVLDVATDPVDMIGAFNFSYSLFDTRDALRTYMENCRRALVDDGILVFDAWGGSGTLEEQEEEREVDDFTYVWDQHRYDPVSGKSECRIHFRFDDGSEMRNAFRYTWRQWSLPEIRELMEEAGFHDVHVLWEGTDKKTGEGNGKYRRVTRGDADVAWIAYVIGRVAPE